MKIGIITFSGTKDNYGQILQIYVLQAFLRLLGHAPFLIRYRERIKDQAKFRLKNTLKYFVFLPKYISWYLARVREKKSNLQYEAQSSNQERKFDDFVDNYISASKEIYDEKSIYTRRPEADAYICGSDQIWGGSWPYYLSFAPDSAIKIAYAPSLGGIEQFSPEYEKKLCKLLKRFVFVGMREESGVRVCKRLGRTDAMQVVDPTLLLDQRAYDAIRIQTRCPDNYIFLYLLGNPISRDVAEFYKFAASQGLDVVYVASQGRIDSFPKVPAQIGEWIDMIANAKYVITNSYHCTVFSLIYKKKFAVIPLSRGYERMNTRIEELLTHCKLTSRILYSQELDPIKADISFSDFSQYQKIEMEKSRTILTKALSGCLN